MSVLSPDPGGYRCPFAFLISIESIPAYPNGKKHVERTFQAQIGFWRELELAQWHLKFGIQLSQGNSTVVSHFQVVIVDLLDQIIEFGKDCDHWNCTVIFLLVADLAIIKNLKTPFPVCFSLKNLSSKFNSGRDRFGSKQNLYQQISE